MSSKRSYTEEFKQGAVDLVVNESLSVGEVGRRLSTSPKNVSRWVQAFDAGNQSPSKADNVLNRQFDTAAPNQVLCSDISDLWTNEGWLYLAVVID